MAQQVETAAQRVLRGIDQDEVVNLSRALIQIDTVNPPGREAAAANLIQRYARQAGLEAELIPLGPDRANILVRLPGRDPNAPRLMFCGHLDTVPLGGVSWDVEPFRGEIVDGQLYGRGASDMKSGVAASVVALGVLRSADIQPKGDVVFLGLAGEEVDCAGARHHLSQAGMDGIGWLVIGEPTNLDLVVAHKGALRIEITVSGRAAHASRPDLGRNAIGAAASAIGRLGSDLLPAVSHAYLTPATLSVDLISGGSALNVVPDQCRFALDIRTLPGQSSPDIIDRLRQECAQAMRSHPDVSFALDVVNEFHPVETAADHPLVGAMQAAAVARTGDRLRIRGVTYYTDASVLQPPSRVPTLIFGPGDDELAHQRNERIKLDALQAATAQLALLPLMLW